MRIQNQIYFLILIFSYAKASIEGKPLMFADKASFFGNRKLSNL